MISSFDHRTLGQRVLFGSGSARANIADASAGASRVMVVSSERDARLAAVLTADSAVVRRWTEVAQHVPTELADRARDAAAADDIDLIVSVGGGSATGLAKAIAMTTRVPILAVPTTYAGSEATNVWGLTADSRKTTGVDDGVLPSTVVYDAELFLRLPRALSIASGLNAVAHGIDALWAPGADPLNATLASEAIRLLAAGLRTISADPASLAGREQTLMGAYLAAVSFTSAGSGLHHKICHVLGGAYGLAHAQTHAVLLPHVTAFNASAAPGAGARIAEALDSRTAVRGLEDLYTELDAPRSLRDIGFNESDIPEAARLIIPTVPASNPRRVDTAAIETILRAAWAGTPIREYEQE
ncbi:maleylacetate reductase [Glaciihabitans tibetensis]|uniref:Maleylacetate reductase n=1 Tax=Glaciihabitans tibetensis TaxID=1266600 RepID=A0A2T0V373_9MICO|nr:maleylacetate reductase [Glaciihabitans tibetensis]PRY64625.1 maleylacetate reductase [Glaciihabitans tibetensis]